MSAARTTPQDRPVKQPQDRQAKAEAQAKDITFTFEDVTYRIDRGNADNVEFLEFVEDQKYISALRGYLGTDQWVKWKDTARDEQGRIPSDRFEPFVQAVMDAIGGGGDAPNS